MRISRASEELARALGGARVALAGTPIDRFLPGAGTALRRAVRAASPSRLSVSLVVAHGTMVATTIEVVPLERDRGAVIAFEQFAAPAVEERLAAVLDHVSDGFAVFDREWRYVFLNRAAERFYGRPRGEMLGRVLWDLFPRALGSELERRMREAERTRAPVELEIVSPQFGRWMQYRVAPYEDGLAFFFRDVDDEHRMREALRESEERHRAMFEHSLTGWLLTAPEGPVLAANPAACRMLARSEEEILRVGRAGIVDTHDPRLEPALEHRRRHGWVIAEMTMVRGDGTRFPAMISSTLYRDAKGQERTTLTFYDVTERRRAEEALACLADLGPVLGASLDLTTTLDRFVHFVAPRIADLCAIELVDEVSCVAFAHRDPQHGPWSARVRPFGAAIDRVVADCRARLVEHVDDAWLVAASERPAALAEARALAPTSLVIVPLVARGRAMGALLMAHVDDARRFDGSMLVLARALAERAALAIEAARQHRAALDAKRLRDDVLAFVAHDLRTPLQAIAMSAGMLSTPQGSSVAADVIRRSIRQATQLVEDLLTVAVVESGTIPLERRPTSIATVIGELIELHRPLAEARGIALDAHVPDALEPLSIDRHRVLQLLSNLVANALKFTHEGGRIDVDVRLVPGAIEVQVHDTGCGIAPEDLPHVFDRFWQSARARRGGAGLGLAIAHGIAEAHGGTLDVWSVVGQGTTFRLLLPRSAQLAAHESPSATR
ncbi:ATP-binding protein [Sandaracinus amylolyticus]|uniref:ATP-binding protein n=1 Tax=Sandaracinus amylolyticus TaxID=927083 RepID=UPI00146FE89C|nr:ATP-binding protein [Sandaracinus amylolyticus]